MKYKLLPHQYKFCTSVAPDTVLIAGRGAGKTFGCSCLIADKLKSGKSILVIAPDYRTLKTGIMREVTNRLTETHTRITSLNKTDMEIRIGKATVYFRSNENPERVRGLTDIDLLVMDEAALCSYETYTIAIACLRGQKVRDPQTYLITTPRGRGNWVSDIYYNDSSLSINAPSSANYHNGQGYTKRLEGLYDETFAKQELLGEILDESSSSVFNTIFTDKLFDSVGYTIDLTKPVIVSLDVARDGKDNSSCSVRRGKLITRIINRHTPDLNALEQLIVDTLGGLEPTDIVVDSTGMGQFIPDILKRKWPKATIYPINFASKGKDGYTNMRTQIHFELRKQVESGEIRIAPNACDDKLKKSLILQCLSVEYTIAGKTDFKLLSKDEVKSKIGQSPDDLDDICLQSIVNLVDVERLNKHREAIRNTPNISFPNNRRGR